MTHLCPDRVTHLVAGSGVRKALASRHYHPAEGGLPLMVFESLPGSFSRVPKNTRGASRSQTKSTQSWRAATASPARKSIFIINYRLSQFIGDTRLLLRILHHPAHFFIPGTRDPNDPAVASPEPKIDLPLINQQPTAKNTKSTHAPMKT